MSQISESEDVDIYGDLTSFSLDDKLKQIEAKYERLLHVSKQLKCRVVEQSETIQSLEKTVKDLRAENTSLGTNISTLLKTASAEIERKDRQIADLRREKDSVVFRRGRETKYNEGNHPQSESADWRHHGSYGNYERPRHEKDFYSENVDSNCRSQYSGNVNNYERLNNDYHSAFDAQKSSREDIPVEVQGVSVHPSGTLPSDQGAVVTHETEHTWNNVTTATGTVPNVPDTIFTRRQIIANKAALSTATVTSTESSAILQDPVPSTSCGLDPIQDRHNVLHTSKHPQREASPPSRRRSTTGTSFGHDRKPKPHLLKSPFRSRSRSSSIGMRYKDYCERRSKSRAQSRAKSSHSDKRSPSRENPKRLPSSGGSSSNNAGKRHLKAAPKSRDENRLDSCSRSQESKTSSKSHTNKHSDSKLPKKLSSKTESKRVESKMDRNPATSLVTQTASEPKKTSPLSRIPQDNEPKKTSPLARALQDSEPKKTSPLARVLQDSEPKKTSPLARVLQDSEPKKTSTLARVPQDNVPAKPEANQKHVASSKKPSNLLLTGNLKESLTRTSLTSENLSNENLFRLNTWLDSKPSSLQTLGQHPLLEIKAETFPDAPKGTSKHPQTFYSSLPQVCTKPASVAQMGEPYVAVTAPLTTPITRFQRRRRTVLGDSTPVPSKLAMSDAVIAGGNESVERSAIETEGKSDRRNASSSSGKLHGEVISPPTLKKIDLQTYLNRSKKLQSDLNPTTSEVAPKVDVEASSVLVKSEREQECKLIRSDNSIKPRVDAEVGSVMDKSESEQECKLVVRSDDPIKLGDENASVKGQVSVGHILVEEKVIGECKSSKIKESKALEDEKVSLGKKRQSASELETSSCIDKNNILDRDQEEIETTHSGNSDKSVEVRKVTETLKTKSQKSGELSESSCVSKVVDTDEAELKTSNVRKRKIYDAVTIDQVPAPLKTKRSGSGQPTEVAEAPPRPTDQEQEETKKSDLNIDNKLNAAKNATLSLKARELDSGISTSSLSKDHSDITEPNSNKIADSNGLKSFKVPLESIGPIQETVNSESIARKPDVAVAKETFLPSTLGDNAIDIFDDNYQCYQQASVDVANFSVRDSLMLQIENTLEAMETTPPRKAHLGLLDHPPSERKTNVVLKNTEVNLTSALMPQDLSLDFDNAYIYLQSKEKGKPAMSQSVAESFSFQQDDKVPSQVTKPLSVATDNFNVNNLNLHNCILYPKEIVPKKDTSHLTQNIALVKAQTENSGTIETTSMKCTDLIVSGDGNRCVVGLVTSDNVGKLECRPTSVNERLVSESAESGTEEEMVIDLEEGEISDSDSEQQAMARVLVNVQLDMSVIKSPRVSQGTGQREVNKEGSGSVSPPRQQQERRSPSTPVGPSATRGPTPVTPSSLKKTAQHRGSDRSVFFSSPRKLPGFRRKDFTPLSCRPPITAWNYGDDSSRKEHGGGRVRYDPQESHERRRKSRSEDHSSQARKRSPDRSRQVEKRMHNSRRELHSTEGESARKSPRRAAERARRHNAVKGKGLMRGTSPQLYPVRAHVTSGSAENSREALINKILDPTIGINAKNISEATQRSSRRVPLRSPSTGKVRQMDSALANRTADTSKKVGNNSTTAWNRKLVLVDTSKRAEVCLSSIKQNEQVICNSAKQTKPLTCDSVKQIEPPPHDLGPIQTSKREVGRDVDPRKAVAPPQVMFRRRYKPCILSKSADVSPLKMLLISAEHSSQECDATTADATSAVRKLPSVENSADGEIRRNSPSRPSSLNPGSDAANTSSVDTGRSRVTQQSRCPSDRGEVKRKRSPSPFSPQYFKGKIPKFKSISSPSSKASTQEMSPPTKSVADKKSVKEEKSGKVAGLNVQNWKQAFKTDSEKFDGEALSTKPSAKSNNMKSVKEEKSGKVAGSNVQNQKQTKTDSEKSAGEEFFNKSVAKSVKKKSVKEEKCGKVTGSQVMTVKSGAEEISKKKPLENDLESFMSMHLSLLNKYTSPRKPESSTTCQSTFSEDGHRVKTSVCPSPSKDKSKINTEPVVRKFISMTSVSVGSDSEESQTLFSDSDCYSSDNVWTPPSQKMKRRKKKERNTSDDVPAKLTQLSSENATKCSSQEHTAPHNATGNVTQGLKLKVVRRSRTMQLQDNH